MARTYMLIDQYNADVLAFLRKPIECLLDRRFLRFRIAY